LDHYYGNGIGIILFYLEAHEDNPLTELPREDINKAFQKFVNGLHTIIQQIKDGIIKPHPDVNENLISELLAICEKIDDPSDKKQLEPLIAKYEAIRPT